jgi:hypothetical protein
VSDSARRHHSDEFVALEILLSASIANYRHQAKRFDGESDRKIGIERKELNAFQLTTRAGDDRVGIVSFAAPDRRRHG